MPPRHFGQPRVACGRPETAPCATVITARSFTPTHPRGDPVVRDDGSGVAARRFLRARPRSPATRATLTPGCAGRRRLGVVSFRSSDAVRRGRPSQRHDADDVSGLALESDSHGARSLSVLHVRSRSWSTSAVATASYLVPELNRAAGMRLEVETTPGCFGAPGNAETTRSRSPTRWNTKRRRSKHPTPAPDVMSSSRRSRRSQYPPARNSRNAADRSLTDASHRVHRRARAADRAGARADREGLRVHLRPAAAVLLCHGAREPIPWRRRWPHGGWPAPVPTSLRALHRGYASYAYRCAGDGLDATPRSQMCQGAERWD
jgi:hypothetical protein